MPSLSRRAFLSLNDSGSADPDPLVHIASLLLQATPAGEAAVRSALADMPSAELHETPHPGKMAIVLESADSRTVAQAASQLQQLPGVLTVSVVAHLTERASLLDEDHESTPVPAR